MIKIVLSDWPDKHAVKSADISSVIDATPSDLYFTTEITTAGSPDEEFDIDVYVDLGGWRVRLPKLSHAYVDLDKVLATLVDYDNGGAVEFLLALAVPKAIVDSAFRGHVARAQGGSSRARK